MVIVNLPVETVTDSTYPSYRISAEHSNSILTAAANPAKQANLKPFEQVTWPA